MAVNYTPPTATTNYSANLMNTLNAAIYSPVFADGIGTLYFEAINVAATSVGLEVYIATNMVGGAALSGSMTAANVDWQRVMTTNLNATSINNFVRVMEKIEISQPVAFRIKRASIVSGALDNFYACIDNIRVSPSVPDIVFSDINTVLNGGGTFVACKVSNAPGTLAPTDHTTREIQLWYRWFVEEEKEPWNTAPMVYQPGTGTAGDGEEWKADFAFEGGKALEYYFVYSRDTVYQSPDYTERVPEYVYPPETGVQYPEEALIQPPEDGESITVYFHAQGGTVSPDEREYVAYWSYTSKGGLPTPERLGYTFDNWFADELHSGDAITNATRALPEVTDLYAKWTANTYTVRYHANGGSGIIMADSPFTYDVAGNLSPNTFTFPGYNFVGWATNAPSYTTVAYTNNESVLNLSATQGAIIELRAVWVGQVYTVTFNPQGGSVPPPASRPVTFGSVYGTLPTPLRAGYAFGGWYTLPEGGGTQVFQTTLMQNTFDHQLYASWSPISYTVTFDPQGGAVSPTSKTVTYDTLYGELPLPTRLGFVFAGWFTAGGTPVTANTQVAITANQTLFAKWADNMEWFTTNTLAITYVIMNEEELHGFSQLVNTETTDFFGKTVILGTELDMSSLPTPWMPIGTNEVVVFQGTFDGQGKVITGLNFNDWDCDNVGLFGILGETGVVKNVNLTLTDCMLVGHENVGGIAGCNYGLIQNCQVLEGFIGGLVNVGGLVGRNAGVVENSFNAAIIEAGSVLGGIAGVNESGAAIRNCYWLTGSPLFAIGDNSGTTSDVYSFSGFPGTLAGEAFNTSGLSSALNGWVQAQGSPFYWWSAGTDSSHPLLTQFAPSLIVQQLSEARILLFDDYYLTNNLPDPTWRHEGPAPAGVPTTPYVGLLAGTNHYHRTGWVFQNVRMGQRHTAFYVPPQMATNYNPSVATTNYSANLMNTVSSVIFSPIFADGIGTLYFEAINVASTAFIDIDIDIATNLVGGAALSGSMATADADWKWVATKTLSATSIDGFVRVVEKLDIRQPAAIRIRRFTTASGAADNFYACLDNIRVSFPPADIVMSKPIAPFDIGYPSVNTPGGQVQCWLDNRPGPYTTSYLGGTRTNIQVVSRWNYIPEITAPLPGWISPWQTNTLMCVDVGNSAGGGEKWEGMIPPYPNVGSLEYYFTGAFNGVRYQSPDYTERGYVYRPEDPSPKIYATGVTTNYFSTPTITNVWGTTTVSKPFQFDVRQYPAVFGEVVAMTDQFGPVQMYLSSTNEWQARVSVVGTAITNLTWYFRGSGEYLGNYTFSPDTVYWSNLTGIRGGVLPYGDNCLRTLDPDIATNGVNRFEVKVVPEESNFVLLTLNTAQGNFMAGRGEYQNFNLWNPGDAGEDKFTDTSDKYPKTAYSQNFDGWSTNVFSAISNYFGVMSVTNLANQTFLWPEDYVGTINWMASSFQYAIDRTVAYHPPDAPSEARRNQAIRLLGGNQYLGLGYIQGNESQYSASVLPGLGTVSFKARLSQQIVPGIYNYGATVHMRSYTTNNYMVRTSTMSFRTPSVERPSVSLIAYYQSPLNFYEYRVTQIPDPLDIPANLGPPTVTIDSLILHEIIRWNNGTPTVLNTTRVTSVGKLTALLGGSGNFEFRVYTDASGTTSLVGHLGTSGGSTVTANQTNAQGSLKFGTFGIHAADCTIDMTNIFIRRTTTGTVYDPLGVETNFITPMDDWALSQLYRHNGRITSLAPTNQINVLTGPSVNGPWALHRTLNVTDFDYATLSANIQTAQPSCVRLQVAGGAPNRPSSDIVLDGITVTSWRGVNEPLSPLQSEWAVTEAMLVTNPAAGGVNNRVSVRMNATQADPARPQSIRSPQIMGIGTITFDYRSLTTNETAILLEYNTTPNPSLATFPGWTPLTNVVCNSPNWTTVNIYFGQAAATNLYVRFLHDFRSGGGSSTNSIIEIDNITIWNNPTNSPNDWVAYNAKVTNTETNRWWIDGLEPVKGRNLSLNNSKTDQAYPSPQGDFNPYVMSPKLLHGLGRVSFIARAYDPTNALVENTSISVFATSKPWSLNIAESDWVKLHTFTHITNAFYQPFSFTVADGLNNYTAVKLAVDGVLQNQPSLQRVCIDEVLVTEQIYAKFDISNVKLKLPDVGWRETRQPLEGEDIGVEAQLTNVLLQPSNIVMYVSYVTGTNTWGVTNAPLSAVRTQQMVLTDPEQRIYRTRDPVIYYGIPEQDNNTVVQYIVWAEYEDAGKYVIYQQPGTFEHPEWYFPINLNERFKSSGWSPYYIVYDVPPGAVWINEVNVYELPAATWLTWERNPYIEIAMPAWMSLAGWSIECLKGPALNPIVTTIGPLPSGLPAKPAYPGANGYTFFVIGPVPGVGSQPPGVTTPLPADYTVPNLGGTSGSVMAHLVPGGLRLKRPMGMYEQAIVYDWNYQNGSGAEWADNDPQKRFRFVGSEIQEGSLSFTGTVENAEGQYVRKDNTGTWDLLSWTPGEPNIGQIIPDAPQPGGSNVLITSVMNVTNGTQNNVRGNTYLLKVKKGESTNIVYQADNWWRLYSVREDGAERLPYSPTSSYTLQLNNLQAPVTVSVRLDVREDLLGEGCTPDMLDWLQKYPDVPLAPTYLNVLFDREMSLRERYWINANPTTTNLFAFMIGAGEVASRPLHLGLTMMLHTNVVQGSGMVLSSNRVERLQGGSVVQAWAAYSLSPMDWFMVSQFILGDNSFDDSNKSRIFINEFPDRPAFFKWALSLEDPRSTTIEMTNDPKETCPHLPVY